MQDHQRLQSLRFLDYRSEICQVTFDTEVSKSIPMTSRSRAASPGSTRIAVQRRVAPGDLTCGPGTIPPTEPLAPAPAAATVGRFTALPGVELTGGSTSNSAVGSMRRSPFPGGKTKIFGNAFAGDMVSTKAAPA